MRIPPARTAKTAAMLYHVYICPIAAGSAPSCSISQRSIAPTLSYAK
jgi:hypothetical protein